VYCHACGQKATAAGLTFHDFAHEATHEFLHLDGKILQTVKLLVAKPGQLTREFLEGRRARYISPMRVYLTFSLIFFTLAAILPRGLEGAVKVSRGDAQLDGSTNLERRLESGLSKTEKDAELLGNAIMRNLPKVMFLLMPLFALLTWAFYRRQQRFYIPHLYYSVHFHAFVFLMMSVYLLVQRAGVPKPLAAMLILVNVPYHFMALRRVFGESRAKTFWKGLAVGAIYWLTAMLIVTALGFWILIHL
jgi:hypothetical protein